MTQHLLITLFLLASAAVLARAEDKAAAQPSQSVESFESLKKEYQNASKTISMEARDAYAQAKKSGKERGFKYGKPHPNIHFSPRFLAIAEKNPKGPEAIDALKMTPQTSIANVPKPGAVLETRAKAVKILRDHYVTKPAIKDFLPVLIQYDDDASKALVAEVIDRSPDRKFRASVYKDQVAYDEYLVGFADTLKNPKQREAFGKEFVETELAKAERAKIELEAIIKTLRENYGDL